MALLLYTRPTADEPRDFPVERIVEALTTREPALEDVIRHGLTDRRHDLDDDSQLSTLVRWLTEYREPLAYSAGGLELPSVESWPGGTLMGASAWWAAHSLTHHHLGWWLIFSALTDPVQVKVDADGGVIRQGLVDRLHVHLVARHRGGESRAREDEVLAAGDVAVGEGRRRYVLLAGGGARVDEAGAGQEFDGLAVGLQLFAG
ncbi:hypothetical protein [Streptomyces sp. NBC_01006]|uniref:hypothetical protein n=1 Tax=Streptomyces sp. NBC_01006 TaxID=2903716 RepID=UPI003870AA5E|nr:hypothetical protein OG509_32715 [Streptomyces sp. NBC_01006]